VDPSDRDRNDPGNGATHGTDGPGHANETPGVDYAWLRSVVENSSEIVTIVDPDGTLRYANPAWERVLGYDPEEAIGTMNVLDHVHPEDIAHVLEETEKALAEGGIITNEAEYRFRRKDGSWSWMESVSTYLLDDPAVGGVVVASRDITERRRVEAALRESEQRFRRSFRDSAIGMALVATDGRWLQVNRSLCEMVGYPQEELLEKTFQDITHPDDLEKDLDHLRRLLAGEIRTYQMEKRYFHREGHVVWILLSVSLVHDEEGEPLYFVSQIQDVSERKRAVEKIREAEERYRTLVERIPVVTYMQQPGEPSRTTYISPQYESILGYSVEEVLSYPEHWVKILHPDDRERVLAEDERTNRSEEPFVMEYRKIAKNG
jgi:PAS domain S-box-containing protein